MVINKKDYLEALDIVEAYHNQIKAMANSKKTLVIDFIDIHVNRIGIRLYNILMSNLCFDKDGNSLGIYVEDIDVHYFLTFKYAGKRTWDEFQHLRDNL